MCLCTLIVNLTSQLHGRYDLPCLGPVYLVSLIGVSGSGIEALQLY